MRKMRLRILARMCSLQTVLLLAISCVVMRGMILPAANAEIRIHTIGNVPIQAATSWFRLLLPGMYMQYSATGRSLFIETELTAGILDALLTFGFLWTLLLYLLLRFRLYRKFGWLLSIPIIGCVADLLQSGGTVYLLSTALVPNGAGFPWVAACSLIRLLALILSAIGILVLVWIHLRTLHVHPLNAEVNTR